MRIAFTVAVLSVLCLFAFAELATTSSGSGKYQEVGGDFGKAWIGNFQSQNNKTADKGSNNDTTLWGWGTVPKGKALVGGKIVDAPNSTWLYNSTNWMVDNYVDPYTGNYIDPVTGQPVYINHQVFPPTETSSKPSTSNQQGPQLPKVLQSLSGL